jgi:hypothetical protein
VTKGVIGRLLQQRGKAKDIRGRSVLKEAGCKTALTRGGGNGDDDGENRCGERCFDGRCRQYALGVKWAALGHFRVEEGGGGEWNSCADGKNLVGAALAT